MRRIRISAAATVLIVGLFAGTIGATAGSASAAAPAGSQAEFCAQVLAQAPNATTPPTTSPTQPPTRKEAWAAEAKRYTKLAKVAPTPALKKALLRIAVYEAGLAKGNKPQGAGSKSLAKAYKVVSLATAKCAATAVPVPGGATTSSPPV